MSVTHPRTISNRPVDIPAGRLSLKGDLSLPEHATGIVVFAHGSGSGRHSPRNQFVSRTLQDAGLGTLLMDLLSEEEAESRENVFDIELLAERVLIATNWIESVHLLVGLFGASTGAAAALVAAAQSPDSVKAVVSRGGRPDLALEYLFQVKAPTLLIVGSYDDACIPLNEEAYALLRCEKKLIVVTRATHLFPEPGALEEVGRLSSEWFARYLSHTPKQ